MCNKTFPTILAIESSCDDTSAAICSGGKILSNYVANQEVHKQYGGVVPELASRAHIQNIVPVVACALKRANVCLHQLDAIAFTQAPGLIGSLLVGAQFAKSLSLALSKPLIAVHHLQAHVLANLIPTQKPAFPFLCLTASGGHTQLVLAHSPYQLATIGNTLDDAVGEAFDKIAKLLGLQYPGGPMIDKYAQGGDPHKFKFAEPQIANLNFSFSGVKTSVLYFLQREKKSHPNFVQENMKDICASVQHTLVTILLKKLAKAVQQTNVKQVCLAGGVSANSLLRLRFKEVGMGNGWQTFVPEFEYCTDNAAMIAIAAHYKYLQQDFEKLSTNPTVS